MVTPMRMARVAAAIAADAFSVRRVRTDRRRSAETDRFLDRNAARPWAVTCAMWSSTVRAEA